MKSIGNVVLVLALALSSASCGSSVDSAVLTAQERVALEAAVQEQLAALGEQSPAVAHAMAWDEKSKDVAKKVVVAAAVVALVAGGVWGYKKWSAKNAELAQAREAQQAAADDWRAMQQERDGALQNLAQTTERAEALGRQLEQLQQAGGNQAEIVRLTNALAAAQGAHRAAVVRVQDAEGRVQAAQADLQLLQVAQAAMLQQLQDLAQEQQAAVAAQRQAEQALAEANQQNQQQVAVLQAAVDQARGEVDTLTQNLDRVRGRIQAIHGVVGFDDQMAELQALIAQGNDAIVARFNAVRTAAGLQPLQQAA
ncbi:hypothetical protein EBZ39_11330 [bacterium]|nr:hypothetical protein [bacterium]